MRRLYALVVAGAIALIALAAMADPNRRRGGNSRVGTLTPNYATATSASADASTSADVTNNGYLSNQALGFEAVSF